MRLMSELTEKQRAVVELLARAERTGSPAPTFREMAAVLRADVRSVYQHVQALERKGVVRRTGTARGIELEPGYAPAQGLPVVGRVAAGLPLLAEQNVDEYVDIRNLVVDEDAFLLKVRGDSMVDRRIYDGDFVLVKPRHRLENGEIGVVSINGEVTVKEVHTFRDRVVLVSHNAAKGYMDQVYGVRQEVKVVGKVIMAFRWIQ